MEETKSELLTICDYASISQDGKLSIIGIFDQIFVNNLPATHSQFYIVGIVKGAPDLNLEVSMQIDSSNGSTAIPVQKMQLKIGPNGRSNIIAGIGNMPINETGFYKVILSSKDEKLGEKEFGVFKSGAQPEFAESSKKIKYKN